MDFDISIGRRKDSDSYHRRCRKRKPMAAILACFARCFNCCCAQFCINKKKVYDNGENPAKPEIITENGSVGSFSELDLGSVDDLKASLKTPGSGNRSRSELYVICSRCSQATSGPPSRSVSLNQRQDTQGGMDDEGHGPEEDIGEDEVFQSDRAKPRSQSTPSPFSEGSRTSRTGATKKSTGDVPDSSSRPESRLALIAPGGSLDSKPTSPTSQTSSCSGHRSPSNYCRVATCEQLHIHDLTPKCLETFAPSSTCSSCQHCDRPHIGPNHDQVLLVARLLKHLQLPSLGVATPTTATATTLVDELPHPLLSTEKNSLAILNHPVIKHHRRNHPKQKNPLILQQWPQLPEYRPQSSPDHLYRTFGF